MSQPQLTAADLAALFDAFNRHDIDAIMAYFAADCVFDTIGGGAARGPRIRGPPTIAAESSGVWAAMKDARWDHHSHFVHGDRAVSEWTFSGTNPDGTRIEAGGSDLFTLCDGKIVRKQAFRKNRPLIQA